MGSIRIGLLIWAVAGPALAGGVSYLAMRAREAIVIEGAVRAARNDEVSKCNEERLEIGRALNDAVEAGVREAVAAADAERAPPSDLEALCQADPDCRKETVP